MQSVGASCFAALILGMVVLAVPAEAGRHDPIYAPGPIQVPAGKSVEDVKKAVRKALFEEEFAARDIATGHIQGERTKTGSHDSHTAVVDILFDNKTIQVGYKDSKNLNYDAKDKTIHSTYNTWVRNIERQIRKSLWSP